MKAACPESVPLVAMGWRMVIFEFLLKMLILLAAWAWDIAKMRRTKKAGNSCW